MSTRNYKETFPQNFLTSVSCEVRFLPLLAIRRMIPDIQSKLREEYPIIEQGFPIQFDGTMPTISSELS